MAKPWGSLLIWSPAECHLYQNGSKENLSITAMLNQQRVPRSKFDMIGYNHNHGHYITQNNLANVCICLECSYPGKRANLGFNKNAFLPCT